MSDEWDSEESSEVADKTLGNEFLGTVIENNYMIINKLGCGTFSSVWLSYSLKDKILVAIKIYHPRDYKESLREIEIYNKINNSNINKEYILSSLNIFEINPIIENDNYYNDDETINKHKIIVLPLMAISTYDLLNFFENGLEHKLVLNIIKQLILGIIEFEKINLYHTDLKPENILIYGKTYKMEYIENIINDLKLDINMDYNTLIKYTNLIIEKINEYKDDNGDMIVEKYLNDIKIKLCDFNLSIEYDENNISHNCQTRYYRAPEIIMGYGFNKKSDYWSIPCIIFELLTNDILFDPEKSNNLTTDMAHIYLIIELLGDIPSYMIKNSPNYKLLFNKNKLKGCNGKIKTWKLNDVINEYDLKKTNELNKLIEIMNMMLVIEPNNRYDLNYILNEL